MVISTVSLNPAIDKTYFVNGFKADSVNRAQKTKVNMGGKGINVSATVIRCGINCVATGFLSGYNGQSIAKYLREQGVTTDFIYTEGETRENIKVVDLVNNTYTDINGIGPAPGREDIEKLYDKVSILANESDVIYLGGSFHPEMGAETYKRLVGIAKVGNARVILDADGEALKNGVMAKPHLIKPNQQELSMLTGRKIKNINDAALAAEEIVNSGIETVLVTMGGNGAVGADKSGVYRAFPLNVPVNSTVGAGDAFLCGFMYGEYQKEDITSSLKYATSFSAAKVRTEGTDIPEFKDLKTGFENVTIEKLK